MTLKVNGVSKTYHDKGESLTVLSQVTFELEEGKLCTVCGPSGSGKTTLLNIISGLDHPDSGEIWFDGKRLDSLEELPMALLRSTQIGIVFQNPNLVAHLTALENVLFPTLFVRTGGDYKSRALSLLGELGLKDKSEKQPVNLSEGERRRVSIARALISNPKLVLADEPTINLDSQNSELVMNLFRRAQEGGTTVFVSTHDEDIARIATGALRIKFGKISSESAA